MPLPKLLATAFCAIALSLAACTGGDDGSTGTTDVAVAERADIAAAIRAADTAVEALDGASSDDDVDAAVASIAAAEAEVAGAGTLSAEEKGGFEASIRLIEGRLALARSRIGVAREERRRELEAERKKLSAALSPTKGRISAVEAAVAHGAAPAMSGTVPGAPLPVTGLETAASGGTVTVAGWTAGTYTAAEEATGTIDTVVLYTDIEASGTQPFSGEGGRYDTTNGLAADGSLAIEAGTDATLIASPGFPSSAGIREHQADQGGMVQVDGTFDGADGRYECTPGQSACTSSLRHGGGYVLGGGGGWRFVPAPGATVEVRDGEYRYFGWWLRDTADTQTVGVFHAGEGRAADEFSDLAALQGPAHYRGPVAGKFSLAPLAGVATAGDYTATAVLKAEFGDGTDHGTIGGTVDEFMVDGDKMPWSVSLGRAAIGEDGSISAKGGDTARTVWSIQGAAVAASGAPLTWEGQLHEVNAQKVPSVATGTFEAGYGDIGRMIGAFGATLEE